MIGGKSVEIRPLVQMVASGCFGRVAGWMETLDGWVGLTTTLGAKSKP